MIDGSAIQGVGQATGGNTVRLVEREGELAELDSLIAGASRGSGAAVLIEGPAGIGKSALRRAAESRAEEVGMRVLTAQGGELESGLPWAVVRDLFAPPLREADERERPSLLSGSAALAGPALGEAVAGPAQPGQDQFAELLHGLYWLTSNLSEQAPLLLAVDDAHWADPTSLDFLTYLAQRLADLPALLLVAGRPAEPGGDARALKGLSERMRVLHPAPLSWQGTEELVRRDFGQEPEPEFVDACQRATAGNPYLLEELVLELRREGFIPIAENAPGISGIAPGAISHAVLLRLARLPDPAMRLAQAVAVLGARARLADSARLAGLDPDEAASFAAELADADVLGRGLPLAFVHPIVRGVVYEQIPAPGRARLHRRAAELLAERAAFAEGVAAHLLEAEPAADAEVVDMLRDAGRASMAEGATSAAAEYLRRALDEPPDARQRPQLLIELARAEAALADPSAVARMQEAVDLLDDPVEQAQVLHELGWLLFSVGRHGDAAEAFSRGIAVMGSEESDLAMDLRTGKFAVSTLARVGLDAVRELSEAGLLDADDRELSLGQRTSLAQLSVARVFAARAADEARELALRALGDGAMLADGGVSLAWSMAVSCLIWCDDLDEAQREIDAALKLLRVRPSVPDRAYVLFGRSWVRLWRGEIAAATADAQAAVDAWSGGWGAHLLGAKWYLSRALIERGDLDEAGRALELAPGERRLEEPVNQAWFHAGRGQLALALGDAPRAKREFDQVESLASEVPFVHNPASFPWRVDSARAALRMGDRPEALRLTDEAVQLAREFGAPRALGFTLCASGQVEGGEEGIGRQREAVEVLERSPSKLERCRALVELGAALRRQGAVSEARERLREGLDLAQRLGGRALEDRAHAELLTAGAKPRRRELSGPDSLTPAERRVCELASSGATNREIAEQLFVSLRTVETHLTHAYQKLDISSRDDLAGALTGSSQ